MVDLIGNLLWVETHRDEDWVRVGAGAIKALIAGVRESTPDNACPRCGKRFKGRGSDLDLCIPCEMRMRDEIMDELRSENAAMREQLRLTIIDAAENRGEASDLRAENTKLRAVADAVVDELDDWTLQTPAIMAALRAAGYEVQP